MAGNDGLYVSPDFLPAHQGICEAGLSKAALQKLHEADRANNVVPLLRFVQVDFSARAPTGTSSAVEAALMLAPTLEALALLAGAATLIHALGVWARSDG
ncbi:phage/plasmid replication protein, gene II/X family [Pseudomonas aeruginosa]|nr:phage/plasmid replication protein, gene II/X family [Pseudomonas aeruginosa]